MDIKVNELHLTMNNETSKLGGKTIYHINAGKPTGIVNISLHSGKLINANQKLDLCQLSQDTQDKIKMLIEQIEDELNSNKTEEKEDDSVDSSIDKYKIALDKLNAQFQDLKSQHNNDGFAMVHTYIKNQLK